MLNLTLGRNSQSLRFKIWSESVGARFVAPGTEDSQTMQGKMDGMARSWNSQDRVVEGGGREITPPGKVDAHTVENDCAHRRENCDAMSGAVSEITG